MKKTTIIGLVVILIGLVFLVNAYSREGNGEVGEGIPVTVRFEVTIDGNPVKAATCRLLTLDNKWETQTGGDGIATIVDVPSGTYKVEVAYSPYYYNGTHDIPINLTFYIRWASNVPSGQGQLQINALLVTDPINAKWSIPLLGLSGTTPDTITLPEGTYVVYCEYGNFPKQSKLAYVKAQQTTSVTFTFSTGPLSLLPVDMDYTTSISLGSLLVLLGIAIIALGYIKIPKR